MKAPCSNFKQQMKQVLLTTKGSKLKTKTRHEICFKNHKRNLTEEQRDKHRLKCMTEENL